jgi:hypothetical protein
MKKIRNLVLAGLLSVFSQVATASVVSNMDFETGNLSSWYLVGTGGVTSNPTEVFAGNYSGYITGQSTLLQNILVNVGQKIDFMWRFIAGDYMPYNDFAFTVNGAGYTLLSSVANVGDFGDSGWQYFSWVAPTTYSGPVLFSIVNIGDPSLNSKLLLDAPVPLPGAALLFGSALLGAGVLRRRKLAADKRMDLAAA